MELSEKEIRDNCPHCNPNSQAFEFPLMETENFRIVCDAHPIVSGHILIIPKEHISCIGEYSYILLNEFLKLYKIISDFLIGEYGSVSSFEHGIFGQTVFHSHVQMMPFKGSPSQIVPEGTEKIHELKYFSDLREIFKKDGGYLFFSIGEDKWIAGKSLAVPRFFRDRFAKALGRPERGNWKEMRKDQKLLEIAQKDDITTQAKWNMYNKKMNKFQNIKAIFFDVGDTLYSNEDMEKEYPRKLYELIAQTKGIDKDQAKTLLKETSEKLKLTEKHVTKVRTMAELGYTRAQVHEAFCKVNPSQFLSKDPKLDSAITKLSKKYKLGIISNFKKSHMLEIFKALGLSEQLLPLMVTEDIVTEIKPAHEPFLKAIELANCKPEECLYVGDSPSKDMLPAKEVGMMTILIKQNPEPKELTNSDYHIEKIYQLLNLLN